MTALRYAADGSYAYEEAWPLVEAGMAYHGSFRVIMWSIDVRALGSLFFECVWSIYIILIYPCKPINGDFESVRILWANDFVSRKEERQALLCTHLGVSENVMCWSRNLWHCSQLRRLLCSLAQAHAPAIPSISPLISPLYIHYVPFVAPPKKRCRTINKFTIKLWWSTFPIIFVWGDLGVAIYDVFLVVKRDTPRPWSTHQTRAFLEFLPGGTLRVGVLSSWFPGCSPTKNNDIQWEFQDPKMEVR